MKLERLPWSKDEFPKLVAKYDVAKNKVKWEIWDDDFRGDDEGVWMQVWREGSVIHCEHIQWYQSDGVGRISVSFTKPDQAVFLCHKLGDIAHEFIDGGFSIEEVNNEL